MDSFHSPEPYFHRHNRLAFNTSHNATIAPTTTTTKGPMLFSPLPNDPGAAFFVGVAALLVPVPVLVANA
jgi:hypothetical protein